MASMSATHTVHSSPTITTVCSGLTLSKLTESEHHHSRSAFRLSSVVLTLLNGNAANGEQKQKKLKMQNAGVKVGEKLYLPGLPDLFLQANSKKQQKRKQNRKSGIVRKAESK